MHANYQAKSSSLSSSSSSATNSEALLSSDECCEAAMCLLALWTIVIFGRFLGGKTGVRGNTVAGDFFAEGGSPRRIDLAGGVTIPGASAFLAEGGSPRRIDWAVVTAPSSSLIFVLGPLVNEFGVCEILGSRNVLVTGIAHALAFKEGVV